MANEDDINECVKGHQWLGWPFKFCPVCKSEEQKEAKMIVTPINTVRVGVAVVVYNSKNEILWGLRKGDHGGGFFIC